MLFFSRVSLGSFCAILFAAQLATPAVADSRITATQDFEIVARLTGTLGSNSINPTWEVGIGGTDLGHSVNHNGKTYFLFGDTFASEATAGSGGPDWRNNVMAYSTDLNPADGITFDGWITRPNGTAKQVITPGNQAVTYIPTGAISANNKIYAWYMHVSNWSTGWTLSHAGLASWAEGDSEFTTVPNYRFENPSGGDYTTDEGRVGGNFGMVAASYRSPLENVDDDHIYLWGTPGGREGGVKLARVLPGQIENLSAYQYYDGTVGVTPQWTNNEYDGEKIIQSGVGEMSVMYNEAVDAWTLMYVTGGPQPDFEIRQSPNPWGPWTDPITVADFSQAPGLYSPYMNPLYTEDGGKTLYFTMSLWDPYDVYLAKVTLDLDDQIDWTGNIGIWSSGGNWNYGVPDSTNRAVVANGGTVYLTSTEFVKRLEVGSNSAQNGRLYLSSSSGELTLGDSLEVFTNGTVYLGGGTLRAPVVRNNNGGEFVFTAGELSADFFEGNLENSGGTFRPGESVGITSITGDYTQLGNAVLAIEIGGTIPGDDFDQVLVNETLTLGGTLDLSLINEFTPIDGQSFDILDWGNLIGTFDTLILPSLAEGLAWDTSQLYSSGVISVGTLLPGDFDHDGNIDGADFLLWQRGGSPNPLSASDLALWQAQYGNPMPAGTVAVPEPANYALFLLSLLFVRRISPKR